MAGVLLTDGLVTLNLRGPIETDNKPRLPTQEVPGKQGSVVQRLGREARVLSMEHGSIYFQGSDAAALADLRQLQAWSDANTVLAVTTLVHNRLVCSIARLRFAESSKKGFDFHLTLVEDVDAAQPLFGGVAFGAVSEEEVAFNG